MAVRLMPAAGRFGSMNPVKNSRGFSMLELLVAVIVIGTVSTILLDRLFYYQEVAEKAEMEYTINAVKSSLRLRMANLLVSGRAQEFGLLAAENPMEWLEQKPRNYLGVYDNADPEQLRPGNWYFDSSARMLVYVVKHGRHLQSDQAGRKCIKWQLILASNQFGREHGKTARQTNDNVSITLTHPYEWF